MIFLVYSRTVEEHELHLKIVLEKLREQKIYDKFSKREFWVKKISFVGNMVSSERILVDLSKVNEVN